MRARTALGGGLKPLGSRVPVIGGLVAGGLEYAEHGDASRAVAAGGGAVGGALAGAAAGAAIGSVVPIVGTAIGGILGGIIGGLGGEKAAKAVHDQFDDEFMHEQKMREAQQQAEDDLIQAQLTEKEESYMEEDLDMTSQINEQLSMINAASEVQVALLSRIAESEGVLVKTPGFASVAGDIGATQRG